MRNQLLPMAQSLNGSPNDMAAQTVALQRVLAANKDKGSRARRLGGAAGQAVGRVAGAKLGGPLGSQVGGGLGQVVGEEAAGVLGDLVKAMRG